MISPSVHKTFRFVRVISNEREKLLHLFFFLAKKRTVENFYEHRRNRGEILIFIGDNNKSGLNTDLNTVDGFDYRAIPSSFLPNHPRMFFSFSPRRDPLEHEINMNAALHKLFIRSENWKIGNVWYLLAFHYLFAFFRYIALTTWYFSKFLPDYSLRGNRGKRRRGEKRRVSSSLI